MTTQVRIDLGNYTDGVGILAGRSRGNDVRAALKLDELDFGEEPVVVFIPESVYSVNSSFFLGLFEKSIFALGESAFRSRYIFEGKFAAQTRDEGIRYALLRGARLRPAARRAS